MLFNMLKYEIIILIALFIVLIAELVYVPVSITQDRNILTLGVVIYLPICLFTYLGINKANSN